MIHSYFQIHRTLFKSKVWTGPAWWSKVWLYMIGRVNFKSTEKLERGEGLFTLQKIIDDCHLGKEVTKKGVRRLLLMMQNDGQITKERVSKLYIKIAILNYEEYQLSPAEKGKNHVRSRVRNDVRSRVRREKTKNTVTETGKDTSENDPCPQSCPQPCPQSCPHQYEKKNNKKKNKKVKKRKVLSDFPRWCQDYALAYLNYSAERFLTVSRSIERKGIESVATPSADTLDKLNRIDGYSKEDIGRVLRLLVEAPEDFFWKKVTKTLSSLRDMTKAGMKFEAIFDKANIDSKATIHKNNQKAPNFKRHE